MLKKYLNQIGRSFFYNIRLDFRFFEYWLDIRQGEADGANKNPYKAIFF